MKLGIYSIKKSPRESFLNFVAIVNNNQETLPPSGTSLKKGRSSEFENLGVGGKWHILNLLIPSKYYFGLEVRLIKGE